MRTLLALIGVGLLATTARGHSILGSSPTVEAANAPAVTIPTSDADSPGISAILNAWLRGLSLETTSGTGSPLVPDSSASPGWTLWELGQVNGNWQFVSKTSNGPGPSALPPLDSPTGPAGTSVALSSEGPWVVKTEYVSLVAFPTPEPSGIVLTVSGLAALVFWRLHRA